MALSGFAQGIDLGSMLRTLEPFHPRNDTFPGEVLMRLAADALQEAGVSRQDPVEYHQIRERYLPEIEFRSRSDHLKSHYAFRAVAMTHGGVTPDLLDDASWWQADDFWIFSTYALLAYLRLAATRRNEPVADLCRRLAQRHAIDLAAAPA